MATVAGGLGGFLPDMDVLIRSSTDPLLFLDYHRHFTHSLFFVPFGGLITALLLWPIFRKNHSFKKLYLFSFLGYLTHGLLDACTTYGTYLFWPFSNMRVAWHSISIIDPLFTLPLLAFVIFALVKKSSKIAIIGTLVALSYLGFGFLQNNRATVVQNELIAVRNHQPVRAEVKPTLFNLVLFRSVYEHEETFYVDAINIFPGRTPRVYQGDSIQKLIPEKINPIPLDSKQFQDVLRFQHFSNDYLSWHPQHPYTIGDIRYALLPHSTEPLWGIILNPKQVDTHVRYKNFRQVTPETWSQFWNMVRSKDL